MKDPLYHVVLVAPEIPQNTGNIGRICCCTECRLHLVDPLSFSLEDKYLRRAGMDYWKHVDFRRHPDWNSLLEEAGDAPLYFFSTKAEKIFWDCPMEPGSFLVFGSEGHGLAPEYHERYADAWKLYRASFPYHEQREIASQKKILRDKGYFFDLIYDGELFVGLLLYWETDLFLYVEHFCFSKTNERF